MVHIVYFPKVFVDLRREIDNYFPALSEELTTLESQELGDILGYIAAYCNILLDGTYTAEDLAGIAELCLKRLFEKRTSIIIPIQ